MFSFTGRGLWNTVLPSVVTHWFLLFNFQITTAFFTRRCFFNMSINMSLCPAGFWRVYPCFVFCGFIKGFKEMGVRASVVNRGGKKQYTMWVYFQSREQRLFVFHVCCGCSAVVQSTPTSFNLSAPPFLWNGFPERMLLTIRTSDYRGTRDFFNERYFFLQKHSSSTFVWKEFTFLCI